MRQHAYRALFAPITLIGLMHIAGGIAVLLEPLAARVSGLAGLRLLNAPMMGLAMVIVGALAVFARSANIKQSTSYILVMPQQIMLMFQLAGIWLTLVNGRYPDGYAPSQDWTTAFWFIFADQTSWIFLCISHFLDMLTPTVRNDADASLQLQSAEAPHDPDGAPTTTQPESGSGFKLDTGTNSELGPEDRPNT